MARSTALQPTGSVKWAAAPCDSEPSNETARRQRSAPDQHAPAAPSDGSPPFTEIRSGVWGHTAEVGYPQELLEGNETNSRPLNNSERAHRRRPRNANVGGAPAASRPWNVLGKGINHWLIQMPRTAPARVRVLVPVQKTPTCSFSGLRSDCA